MCLSDSFIHLYTHRDGLPDQGSDLKQAFLKKLQKTGIRFGQQKID